MGTPKIFISSTIYDFSDLRSALKYWLEELGYNVQLSETSSFEKELNLNSYEACLKSIEACDIYILLIGSRVGGFFNKEEQVTITQQEYRHAYELAKQGKIKIIPFVRKGILDIKLDRSKLANYLKYEYSQRHEITESEISKIANHKSDFVNDADIIFDFIDEVSRKAEMKEAVKSGEEFPIYNWVHPFDSFKDIIDVLTNELKIENSIQRRIMLCNVESEIIYNLKQLYLKFNDSISPCYIWASYAREHLTEEIQGDSLIKGKHLKWLKIYEAVGAKISQKLIHNQLLAAVQSEFLFTYDRNDHVFRPSELHQAINMLIREIERLKLLEDLMHQEISGRVIDPLYMVTGNHDFDGEKSYSITNKDVLVIMSIHDCQYNIDKLSKYILWQIEGKDIEFPVLYNSTPFKKEAENIEKESVSLEEIKKFLDLN